MACILLIEDDPALRRGLLATLRAAGYAIDTAGDGASGFEIARKEPYALIIFDVGLPDLSGMEVLKRLRQHGTKTPILILTARGELRFACRRNGTPGWSGNAWVPLSFRPACRPQTFTRRGARYTRLKGDRRGRWSKFK